MKVCVNVCGHMCVHVDICCVCVANACVRLRLAAPPLYTHATDTLPPTVQAWTSAINSAIRFPDIPLETLIEMLNDQATHSALALVHARVDAFTSSLPMSSKAVQDEASVLHQTSAATLSHPSPSSLTGLLPPYLCLGPSLALTRAQFNLIEKAATDMFLSKAFGSAAAITTAKSKLQANFGNELLCVLGLSFSGRAPLVLSSSPG